MINILHYIYAADFQYIRTIRQKKRKKKADICNLYIFKKVYTLPSLHRVSLKELILKFAKNDR